MSLEERSVSENESQPNADVEQSTAKHEEQATETPQDSSTSPVSSKEAETSAEPKPGDSPQQQASAEEVNAEVKEESSPAAGSATSEAEQPQGSAGESSEGSTPEQGRKLSLNPTVDASQAKAVPSLNPTAQAQVEQKTSSEEGSSEESSASQQSGESAEKSRDVSAQDPPSRGPVEIPDAEDLDVDLESQLAAALTGEEKADSPASPAAGVPKDDSDLEPGTKLKGRVDSVDADQILIDIGYRSTGILSRKNLPEDKTPSVGDEVDVVVESIDESAGAIHLILPSAIHRAGGDWNSLTVGQVVECSVDKTNKGGLSVTVSQLRGFMPAGQVDLHYVGDLEPFVGQKLTARVIDVNPKKKNLVVSRKALLQEEREKLEAVVWEELSVGEQRTGTVKSLKDYGAFVDIGGVDGLVHVREMSWTRINHPSDVLKEGEQIEVKVLDFDKEKKKISLGMKQLLANPWEYADQKYPRGTVVNGIVKKITDFGAFVEIEPGLEGLIHISELDYKRVNHVREVLKEGQEVEAKVLDVNKNKKRISLSIKANKPKPQLSPEEKAKREADAEERKRLQEEAEKRRHTLKGGTSSGSGSGLFGNPNDFT